MDIGDPNGVQGVTARPVHQCASIPGATNLSNQSTWEESDIRNGLPVDTADSDDVVFEIQAHA